MIDFNFTDICSFEPITEEFYSKELFKPIDPFEITLRPKVMRLKNVNGNKNGNYRGREFDVKAERVKFEFTVKSFVEVEFTFLSLSFSDSTTNISTLEFPILLKRGQSHVFVFEYSDILNDNDFKRPKDLILSGSFRLAGNQEQEINSYQWKFKFPCLH